MTDLQPDKQRPKISFNQVLFVLFIFIVMGAVATAYFMSREGKWMTYQQCKKLPGSQVQESYPHVCTTAQGERFYNPIDQPNCGRARGQPLPDACR